MAKAVQAPIFHVNADDPEACVRVARLAFDYRQRFNKDVVIDIIGYRRHGHNEGDDPSYTQPVMYRKIGERPSVRTLYTQTLIDQGDISMEEATRRLDYFQAAAADRPRRHPGLGPAKGLRAKPAPPPLGVLPHVQTGVDAERARPHPRRALGRARRLHRAPQAGPPVRDPGPDVRQSARSTGPWPRPSPTARCCVQGTSVRLAGQDSRRGTFAHRHATLHDYETGAEYTPLTELAPAGTNFWIYDSTLSEYAALGFEYGYSLTNRDALVLWEAQFGDFVNGAQIVIDQYLVAAEDKWNETSGLVLLLPHGYEGQGPDHSSARLERFLQLCAEDNIQVANVSTAAQFFHLLRRQMHAHRAQAAGGVHPQVGPAGQGHPVAAVGLHLGLVRGGAGRHRRGRSRGGEAASSWPRARWPTRPSPTATPTITRPPPWCGSSSSTRGRPGPGQRRVRYPNSTEVVWLQEEPENMGAWNSIKAYLFDGHGMTHKVRRVSRAESGSPATGSNAIHQQEQEELLNRAFGALG